MDEIERLEREYDRLEDKRSDLLDEFYRLQRRRDALLLRLEREEDPRIRAAIKSEIGSFDEFIVRNKDDRFEANAQQEEVAHLLRQEVEFKEKRARAGAEEDDLEPPKLDPEKGFDTDDWEEQRRLYMERKRKLKR